jgi:hypothetical protein
VINFTHKYRGMIVISLLIIKTDDGALSKLYLQILIMP